MSEPSEEEANLSSDELSDLVRVETAPNVVVGEFLASVLEDAGIPAVVLGGSLSGLTGGLPTVEVRVPRKLVARASTVLLEADQQIRESKIESAFEEENVASSYDENSDDPEFRRMAEIGSMPPHMVKPALIPHVLGWLRNGEPAESVAKYLAAAGLNREEASSLLEEVKSSDEYKHSPGGFPLAKVLALTFVVLAFALFRPIFLCALLLIVFVVMRPVRKRGKEVIPNEDALSSDAITEQSKMQL